MSLDPRLTHPQFSPLNHTSVCLSISHSQILPGNVNTYSEVENVLQPVIFATKIRIYPYNQYERTVCLRVEIVGCPSDGEYYFCCGIQFDLLY